MTKIGILGGSFNPVHIGHLLMAEYAKQVADLDIVILMPSGISYMKKQNSVLPGWQRLKMLELGIGNNPNLITSDIEIRRSGNTYTYETLLHMKTLCPHASLYFIVGADSLFSIERWVNPEIIFQNCILLAANRNNVPKEELLNKKNELEERFQAHIIIMDFPQIDISSTTIRANIRTHKSVRYMVPENVLNYIQANQLSQD